MTPASEECVTEFPLEDWMLVLEGLPRAHHKLNRRTLIGIFGDVGMAMIDIVYHKTLSAHESIGDLRALQRSAGPQSLADIQASAGFQTINRTAEGNFNTQTRPSRQEFVGQAVRDGSRRDILVVPRHAIIRS